MDASYKIQRGIHVHLIQFFMCPEFWVHIRLAAAFLLSICYYNHQCLLLLKAITVSVYRLNPIDI